MKAKVTITWEYEIKPRCYPEGSTLEEMLLIDLVSLKNDPTCIPEDIEVDIKEIK